jgi:hypothetical protein
MSLKDSSMSSQQPRHPTLAHLSIFSLKKATDEWAPLVSSGQHKTCGAPLPTELTL